MGAGKSSVGKRLSEKINIPFSDSDNEIELAAGMTVSEIFEKFGEAYFRAGEERVIKRLLSGTPLIIATGGGAFMSHKIRKLVKVKAISVWLKADVETLWQRVHGKGSRPLLNVKNPKETLKNLILERNPVYELADFTVQSKKYVAHSAMVSKIVKSLNGSGELEQLNG